MSTISTTFSFDPGTTAVLVIDMANDFVHPGGTIADAGGPDYQARARSIIPALKRLLTASRDAKMPVVYVTDAHTPQDTELRKWPPHAMKGTRQAAIVDELAPEYGDLVLEKTTYSPFVSTDIDRLLKDRGIRTLLITGLHTDCCCRHTSGDAFQRGYDMVWVRDGMQAFSDEAHQAGLEYFKAWYAIDAEAQVRSVDQVIDLCRSALPA